MPSLVCVLSILCLVDKVDSVGYGHAVNGLILSHHGCDSFIVFYYCLNFVAKSCGVKSLTEIVVIVFRLCIFIGHLVTWVNVVHRFKWLFYCLMNSWV